MDIQFYKYHGTGNDFILVDNRLGQLDKQALAQKTIQEMCDRHFGIGADGFIMINKKEGFDFEMEYYNSDGNESTMCGNGGRCMVAFAQKLGIIEDKAHFMAIDGEHLASISNGIISLQMKDVKDIKVNETYYQLNTGSPHYVSFVDDVNDIKVKQEGALIRNSPMFEKEGINVNFVQEIDTRKLFVRTYERGVEDETLSCGTGVTACALVQMYKHGISEVKVETLGGELKVCAQGSDKTFTNIFLEGPATFVFQGKIQV